MNVHESINGSEIYYAIDLFSHKNFVTHCFLSTAKRPWLNSKSEYSKLISKQDNFPWSKMNSPLVRMPEKRQWIKILTYKYKRVDNNAVHWCFQPWSVCFLYFLLLKSILKFECFCFVLFCQLNNWYIYTLVIINPAFVQVSVTHFLRDFLFVSVPWSFSPTLNSFWKGRKGFKMLKCVSFPILISVSEVWRLFFQISNA